MTRVLPWTTIETLPGADREEITAWQAEVEAADEPGARVHALVGRALSTYWAAQSGASEHSWAELAQGRNADVAEAVTIARRLNHDQGDLVAKALLGRLYATWGPDAFETSAADVGELAGLIDSIVDIDLRLRCREWLVLDRFNVGDLSGARREIAHFTAELGATAEPLFQRRVALWQANLAMLEGRFDEAVRLNQATISYTADSAGSPFSFQNVAITVAVERFFRRRLDEVIDTIESIRASSPRVGANWEVGLAFALAESGELGEARELFDSFAPDDFSIIPRDLNWLVTIMLLAMTAIRLDDTSRCATLLALLEPASELDATHGFGYASYGPVGRIIGSLASKCGDAERARHSFGRVLTTRAPGPWTSLCRLDRASASIAATSEQAAVDGRQAERELRGLELDRWADEARSLWVRAALDGYGAPIARRDSARGWALRHPTGSAELSHGVGLNHLTTLLEHPGRPIDVADLDPAAGLDQQAGTAVMSTLDDQARNAYRRRLTALDASEQPLQVHEREEREHLRRELAGGHHAPSVSTELERLRVRVTKAIHREVARITAQSPTLGGHLRESIETGRHCVYSPADGQGWDVVTD